MTLFNVTQRMWAHGLFVAASLAIGASSVASAATTGQPVTPLISVPSSPPDLLPFQPGDSSIARDAVGNFIVVWSGFGLSNPTPLHARLFAADGTPRGNQFDVDAARADPGQVPIAVSMDSLGNFVVAWRSNDHSNPFDRREVIYAKLFNQDGSARGNRIEVVVEGPLQGLTTSSEIEAPSVAMNDSDDFLVAWVTEETVGPGGEVFLDSIVSRDKLKAQRYASDGTPRGDTLTLAEQTLPNFINPGVRIAASDSGQFAVVYHPGLLAFEVKYPFYARLYSADGRLSPLPIRLDISSDLQAFVSRDEFAVTFLTNGDLLLAWSAPDRADYRKATQEKIFIRRFSPAGLGRGLPVQVATRAPSGGHRSTTSLSLAPTPSAGSVITWPDVTGPNAGIYGRYYAAGETPLVPQFFIASAAIANGGSGANPLLNATTDSQGNLLATFGSVYAQIFKGP